MYNSGFLRLRMKIYQWIIFDADETLFRFDSFKGLQMMFANLGVPFSQEDYYEYQAVNKSLWTAYQKGKITAEQIGHQRFDSWANKLQIPAQQLNHEFLVNMAEICAPLEGAVSLVKSLKGKFKLCIITNGFKQFQQVRMERTGLKGHFEFIVTSEEVGVAKPDSAIFNHAIHLMGNPSRDQILMVGDTLESDILGGINSGLDTCWFNAHNKKAPKSITPHYQIASLMELEKLFL